MDTADECICCQAISAVSSNMEDGDMSCITERGSFVQHLSFLLKGPIRACRRVRVYSPHWLLVSALFLFFIA
jgi:hypothetical protein